MSKSLDRERQVDQARDAQREQRRQAAARARAEAKARTTPPAEPAQPHAPLDSLVESIPQPAHAPQIEPEHLQPAPTQRSPELLTLPQPEPTDPSPPEPFTSPPAEIAEPTAPADPTPPRAAEPFRPGDGSRIEQLIAIAAMVVVAIGIGLASQGVSPARHGGRPDPVRRPALSERPSAVHADLLPHPVGPARQPASAGASPAPGPVLPAPISPDPQDSLVALSGMEVASTPSGVVAPGMPRLAALPNFNIEGALSTAGQPSKVKIVDEPLLALLAFVARPEEPAVVPGLPRFAVLPPVAFEWSAAVTRPQDLGARPVAARKPPPVEPSPGLSAVPLESMVWPGGSDGAELVPVIAALATAPAAALRLDALIGLQAPDAARLWHAAPALREPPAKPTEPGPVRGNDGVGPERLDATRPKARAAPPLAAAPRPPAPAPVSPPAQPSRFLAVPGGRLAGLTIPDELADICRLDDASMRPWPRPVEAGLPRSLSRPGSPAAGHQPLDGRDGRTLAGPSGRLAVIRSGQRGADGQPSRNQSAVPTGRVARAAAPPAPAPRGLTRSPGVVAASPGRSIARATGPVSLVRAGRAASPGRAARPAGKRVAMKLPLDKQGKAAERPR